MKPIWEHHCPLLGLLSAYIHFPHRSLGLEIVSESPVFRFVQRCFELNMQVLVCTHACVWLAGMCWCSNWEIRSQPRGLVLTDTHRGDETDRHDPQSSHYISSSCICQVCCLWPTSRSWWIFLLSLLASKTGRQTNWSRPPSWLSVSWAGCHITEHRGDTSEMI